MRTQRYSDAHRYGPTVDGSEAVRRWQAWAADAHRAAIVRCARGITSPFVVEAWGAYARGETLRSIAEKHGVSKRRVSWAIALVVSNCPVKAPLPNPLRRTARYAPTRDPRETYYAARRARLNPQPQQEDDFWIS